MEERFYSLTQKVFKKDPAAVTAEDTQALAAQYPYFAPIHFIGLLQQSEGTEAYQQQFQKSILYYPDPLAFEQFVHGTDNAGWDGAYTEPDGGDELRPLDEEPANEQGEEMVAGFVSVEDNLQAEADDTEYRADAGVEMPPLPNIEGPNAVELETRAPEEEAPVQEISLHDSPVHSPAPVEAQNPGTELTFEPYHTVDYFASQGIKITAESLSQDKFGKQVKSFTDWLKTMKRLPLAELGKGVTPNTEKKVENLAEHSVADANVVTESMAQVWEKQGNIAKATEVYHKLSLQNPSKRAYFAAKIDKLTEEN